MADIFSVIADPTRRHVLSLLLERYIGSDHVAGEPVQASAITSAAPLGEISVSDLVVLTNLTQPTVSKHLKVLRDAGLVTVREVGQHRYYALDASPLEEIEDWVIPFLSADFDDVTSDDGIDFDEQLHEAAEQARSSAAKAGERVGQTVAAATERARSIFGEAARRFPNISRSSD